MRPPFRLALVLLGTFGVVASCTPAELGALERAAPAGQRGACLVLRAVSDAGAVRDVCATADELVPLVVPLLVDALAEHTAREENAPTLAGVTVSVDNRAPRRAERRRCVAWRMLDGGDDSGSGAEAGIRDAERPSR